MLIKPIITLAYTITVRIIAVRIHQLGLRWLHYAPQGHASPNIIADRLHVPIDQRRWLTANSHLPTICIDHRSHITIVGVIGMLLRLIVVALSRIVVVSTIHIFVQLLLIFVNGFVELIAAVRWGNRTAGGESIASAATGMSKRSSIIGMGGQRWFGRRRSFGRVR